jgi:hypothetical protein
MHVCCAVSTAATADRIASAKAHISTTTAYHSVYLLEASVYVGTIVLSCSVQCVVTEGYCIFDIMCVLCGVVVVSPHVYPQLRTAVLHTCTEMVLAARF